MSFGLGFWAAAGAGGAASAGAYEQIATAFGTGSSATILFSSIPQTYKHLQIRSVSKSDGNASGINLRIQLSGISSTSYRSHQLRGNGIDVISQDPSEGTDSSMWFFDASIGSNVNYPNMFSPSVIDILDYTSTSKNKTIKILSGFASGSGLANRIGLRSGFLNNTSAVTSVSITGEGSWLTASRFSLYGIKG
jgi:hypothetical protein